MSTFIKTGFWEKRTKPAQGYKGELNLENFVQQYSQPGATGPQGPTGPQGVAGTNGVPGPVGPMGLVWKGAWVSGTSYILNDAVGENGASWFCILATSGTTAPHLDGTHWALLASQGAIGPAGAQGPTGATGPAGATGTITQDNEVYSTLSPFTQLISDINWVISTGPSQIVLLPLGAAIGKEIIIYAYNNPYTFQVRANFSGSTVISTKGIETFSNFVVVSPNENYKFTSIGNGEWKAEAIGPNLQQIANIGSKIVSGANRLTLNAGFISVLDENTLLGNVLYKDSLRFNRDNGSGSTKYINLLSPTTIADNRTIVLPDASGTVALQTYKSYVAKLSHAGGITSIATTVVENTIDPTLYWDVSDSLNYAIISTGNLFTSGKTVVFATSSDTPLMKVGVAVNDSFPNVVGLTVENDTFDNLMIEIRVYN